MSKIDEVKKIIQKFEDDSPDAGYGYEVDAMAEQICQLFVPDKVKVREQTLREVGEWLNERLPAMCDMDERYHILIHRDEIKELEAGRMP